MYVALPGELVTGIMLPMTVSSKVTDVAMGGSFIGTENEVPFALYLGANDPARCTIKNPAINPNMPKILDLVKRYNTAARTNTRPMGDLIASLA